MKIFSTKNFHKFAKKNLNTFNLTIQYFTNISFLAVLELKINFQYKFFVQNLKEIFEIN